MRAGQIRVNIARATSCIVLLVVLIAGIGCDVPGLAKVRALDIPAFFPRELISSDIVAQIAPMRLPFGYIDPDDYRFGPAGHPYRTREGIVWYGPAALDLNRGLRWELPGVGYYETFSYNPNYSQYWAHDYKHKRVLVAQMHEGAMYCRSCDLEYVKKQVLGNGERVATDDEFYFVGSTKDACLLAQDRYLYKLDMRTEELEYLFELDCSPFGEYEDTLLLPGFDSVVCTMYYRHSILYLANAEQGWKRDINHVEEVTTDSRGRYIFIAKQQWIHESGADSDIGFKRLSFEVLDGSTFETLCEIPYKEMIKNDETCFTISSNYNGDLLIYFLYTDKRVILSRESGWQSGRGFPLDSGNPDYEFNPVFIRNELIETPGRIASSYKSVFGKKVAGSSAFWLYPFNYLNHSLEIIADRYLVSCTSPLAVEIFDLKSGKKIYELLSSTDETVLEIFRIEDEKERKLNELGILVRRKGVFTSRLMNILGNGEIWVSELDYRGKEVQNAVDEVVKSKDIESMECRILREINRPYAWISDIPMLSVSSPKYTGHETDDKTLDVYKEGKKVASYEYPHELWFRSILNDRVMLAQADERCLFINLKTGERLQPAEFVYVDPSYETQSTGYLYHAFERVDKGKSTLLVYSNASGEYKFCSYRGAKFYSFVNADYVVLEDNYTRALFLARLSREGIPVTALKIEEFVNKQ